MNFATKANKKTALARMLAQLKRDNHLKSSLAGKKNNSRRKLK
jgi:hypothetical protein